MSAIYITDTSSVISVVNDEVIITVNNQPLVVEVSNQGPQGIPGEGIIPGGLTGQALLKKSDANYDTEWGFVPGGGVVSAVAGQIISALKVVYTDPATGKLFYADKDIPATVSSLLGVTILSGIVDDEITVISAGELEDLNWNWNMAGNVSLFLGSNGTITQGTQPGAIVARIGYAISETKIMVRFGEPVLTN